MAGKWTKGKFFKKILLHKECEIEEELKNKIIEQYNSCTLQTEKLRGYDNLYSIKLSYKERFIAKLDEEKNLMIFEYDQNHKYKITNKEIYQNDCNILLDEEPEKLFLSKNGNWIRFDEQQTSIIKDVTENKIKGATKNKTISPGIHLVSGIAGAGKTLIAQYIALEKLETDSMKAVLYVTKSSELLQEVKSSLPKEVDAKNVSEVIKPYLKKNDTLFKKYAAELKLSENEFYAAIEYRKIVGEFPGKKYLNDAKITSLEKCYKDSIYNISKIAHNKKYKLILIDEGQDLTPYELLTLVKLAKNYGKVVVFYDQNQLLSGINFNMKQLFSKIVTNVTEYEKMHHTHRNPLQVQNLIKQLFKKTEIVDPNKKTQVVQDDGYVKWITSVDEKFQKATQDDITLNPLEFLVITYHQDKKEKAIEIFGKNALILTVEEVKGLEFKRIIVFDFPKLDQSDENYNYIRNAYNVAISRSTEGVEMVFLHSTNGNYVKTKLGHNNDLSGIRGDVKKLTIEFLIEELENKATEYQHNALIRQKIEEAVLQHFKTNPNDISEFKAWLNRDDTDNKIYNGTYEEAKNNYKTQIEKINLTKLTNNYNKTLKNALDKFSKSDMLQNATTYLIKSITDNSNKCKTDDTLLPSFDKLALIGKNETDNIFSNKYKILNNIPDDEFLSKFKETNLNLKIDGYLFNEINYLETWLINLEAWIINIFVQDNLSKFQKLAQDNGIDINNISYKDIEAIRHTYKKLALKLHPDKNGSTDSSNSQFIEFFELAKSIEKGEIHSNSSINTLSERVATYMNYSYLLDSGLKITDKALSFDKDNILGKNTLMLGIESINLFLIYNRALGAHYLIASNISKVIAENWDEDEGMNYANVIKDVSITVGEVAVISKVAKLTLAINTLSLPALSYSIYYSACSVSNKIHKLTEEYRASWNTYIWADKTNSKTTKKSAKDNKLGPITIDIDTNTVIDAISKGDQKTVDDFITKARDVNMVIGQNGYTSLAYAVYYKSEEMVKFLIDKGANVNARDNSMRTPLHLAIKNNYNEIAKYLIKRGSDINAQNIDKHTPLITAVDTNNEEMLIELIAKKADINIQDLNKQTALTYAAYKGYLWAVKKLVKADANYKEAGIISIKDNLYGFHALMVAERNGHKEIANLLREKIADYNRVNYIDTTKIARDFRAGEGDHEDFHHKYHKMASELSIDNDGIDAADI